MNTSFLRRSGVASATLLLALTLAACGGSDGSDGGGSDGDDSSASAVPSEDELSAALLTSDDVPEGYVQSVPEDSDDSEVTLFDDTCLADVSKFDDQVGSEPASKAKTEFTLDEAATQAQVTAGISVYEDEDAVTDAFGTFYDSLAGCTNVTFTDAGGNAYDIDVAVDDAVTIDGADSQLTITLSGDATAGDQSLPIDFGFVVVRQGAATSALGTSEIGSGFDVNDQIAAFAQTQSDRLADVLG